MNDLLMTTGAHRAAPPKTTRHASAILMSAAIGALLSACGGGGTEATSTAQDARSGAEMVRKAESLTTTSHADAFRLLTQATMGPTDADVAHAMAIGPAAWIDEQLAKPVRAHHLQRWNSDAAVAGVAMPNTVDSSFYQEAVSSDDQLRQRVTYALSQIFVVSLQDVGFAGPKSQMAASYLDMLANDSFGTYRQLLQDVSMHPAMGVFLSTMANRNEDPRVGRIPDQNYAREVMQLFSIGLLQLNIDGTSKAGPNGQPAYTYYPTDIEGLSRVFTGFSWAGPDTSQERFFSHPGYQAANRQYTPMQGYPQYHSVSAKSFLGVTVPAQTTANPAASLKTALDTIAAHPNVGPFISKQLIQRLVSSNPSPAYVARVARLFNDNGSGVRGDLKAVVRAILLDNEARGPAMAAGPGFGKLKEPVLRLTSFLRAYKATSDSGLYLIGNTDDPGAQLAQSPLRSPTVFNFYRPEYVNAGGATAAQGMVAPEMQITTESSVAGYPNFMMAVLVHGIGSHGLTGLATRNDVQPDLSGAIALSPTSSALVDDVTVRLIGDTVDTALKQQIQAAVDSIVIPVPNKNNTNQTAIANAQRYRAQTAILLTLASPEFIAQK